MNRLLRASPTTRSDLDNRAIPYPHLMGRNLLRVCNLPAVPAIFSIPMSNIQAPANTNRNIFVIFIENFLPSSVECLRRRYFRWKNTCRMSSHSKIPRFHPSIPKPGVMKVGRRGERPQSLIQRLVPGGVPGRGSNHHGFIDHGNQDSFPVAKKRPTPYQGGFQNEFGSYVCS